MTALLRYLFSPRHRNALRGIRMLKRIHAHVELEAGYEIWTARLGLSSRLDYLGGYVDAAELIAGRAELIARGLR